MPVTALDPKIALIVVDLQKGIVSLPSAHPMDGVVKHVEALLEAFRGHGLPVVLVNVAGAAPGRTEQPRPHHDLPAGWSDLIPELNIARVGNFDPHAADHVIASGVGFLLMGVLSARLFGRFHGGNSPAGS